jgi:transposase InsO family protein
LEPALEAMSRQFPFRIQGFHSDNGSDFLNKTAARLLEKLRIEQTKSRPRRSNDNGLVETNNGAIIRKRIGYGHIDANHAEPLNSFYRDFSNPSLNYHRPCAQPEIFIDDKGRNRITYQCYQTLLETLLALHHTAKYFRPGLSIHALQRVAAARSDTEAAQRMQQGD